MKATKWRGCDKHADKSSAVVCMWCEIERLRNFPQGDARVLLERNALKTRLTTLEFAAKQVLYQISTDGDVQQACADLEALLTASTGGR